LPGNSATAFNRGHIFSTTTENAITKDKFSVPSVPVYVYNEEFHPVPGGYKYGLGGVSDETVKYGFGL
jgi:hypothetical protein